MDYILTAHAREEMVRRQIDPVWVDRVMKKPEQKLPGVGNRAIFQARIEAEGKMFLVRCIVEDWRNPPAVITVYRTTKIAKYWRQP
jgi:hypothetical protein